MPVVAAVCLVVMEAEPGDVEVASAGTSDWFTLDVEKHVYTKWKGNHV